MLELQLLGSEVTLAGLVLRSQGFQRHLGSMPMSVFGAGYGHEALSPSALTYELTQAGHPTTLYLNNCIII